MGRKAYHCLGGFLSVQRTIRAIRGYFRDFDRYLKAVDCR